MKASDQDEVPVPAPNQPPENRRAPLDIKPDEFRKIAHNMVDRLADILETLPDRRVYPDGSLTSARDDIGEGPLPDAGQSPSDVLDDAVRILFDKSVLISHPRFWANVNGCGSPIGAVADFLASILNANLSAWQIGPAASEIERQTIGWIAELIGFPSGGDGILVSGGSMANTLGLHAARNAQTDWDSRSFGVTGRRGEGLKIYATRESHVWLKKATDLLGIGTNAIHWVATDATGRMSIASLKEAVQADRAAGYQPSIVSATAGTVSTGAVDPLPAIAAVCETEHLWLHVDGAYGGLAAATLEAGDDLRGICLADSLAVDPHKWLYAPFDVGCLLVRHPDKLTEAFAYPTTYYPSSAHSEETPLPYRDKGMQTSRAFRALKVWLNLKTAGRSGYQEMIGDDIKLARYLYDLITTEPLLEAMTNGLSITTFRFVPDDLKSSSDTPETLAYLNKLNATVLTRLQNTGWAYPSQTMLNDAFVIRVCIVNFRTSASDIELLPKKVIEIGRETDCQLRPPGLE